MKLFVLAALVAAVAAYDPLYLDELEKMVSYSDKQQLEWLEDDDWTPRIQLQQKRDEILARQSPQVQQQFESLVKMMQANRATSMQYQSQQAQTNGVGDAWTQIQQIEDDLTLSENEADQKKRLVKNQLGYGQRRTLDNIDSNELDWD